MDYAKERITSIAKRVENTNCYIWATEQRRKCGGRVVFRWTVYNKTCLIRWFHALHLEPKHDHLIETKFNGQKYWSIGCSHWKGIPFPRIYWLAAEHGNLLRQAVPEKAPGKVIFPPLLFDAHIKHGD